jgi:hypothetical protein
VRSASAIKTGSPSNFARRMHSALIARNSRPAAVPHSTIVPRRCRIGIRSQAWRNRPTEAQSFSWEHYSSDFPSWTGTAFIQEGNSPNFQAGWCTLTCCKHDVRSARPFNDELKKPGNAVFIFTLARQDANEDQNLVSVAKVTKYFATMGDYAAHLLASGNSALITSRLTRCVLKNSLGWRFGDCHADQNGCVGPPNPNHVHGSNYGNCWADDIAHGHRLLMSDCFLIWSQSAFRANNTLMQARYGRDINAGSLLQLLK